MLIDNKSKERTKMTENDFRETMIKAVLDLKEILERQKEIDEQILDLLQDEKYYNQVVTILGEK